MRLRRLLRLVMICTFISLLNSFILIQFLDTIYIKLKGIPTTVHNLSVSMTTEKSSFNQMLNNQKSNDEVLTAPTQTTNEDVKLIRGIRRTESGYLTIGLCSVPREKVLYLKETMHSLIKRMSDQQRDNVVVVLYLGSFDQGWVKDTLAFIDKDFANEIQIGILQVVQPNPSIYPNFTQITKRTFDDPQSRVEWRVKQNIDYAYLFGYCAKLNKYYIHVEDDVTAATNYIKDIQTFVTRIESSKKVWFMIDFCKLGFIGKLFRSSDLEKMKRYFLLFQEEKPGDNLIEDMAHIMTQIKPISSFKSLFQHRGFVSSLENKTQNLTDSSFKDRVRQFPNWKRPSAGNNKFRSFKDAKVARDAAAAAASAKGRHFYRPSDGHVNPQAKITTSMKWLDGFTPEKAYRVSFAGFFWGKDPKINDFYQVKLEKVTTTREIIIKTGLSNTKKDMLRNGSLRVGRGVNAYGNCVNMRAVGRFINGEIHIKQEMEVRCINIVVQAKQNTWVIIREIKVITKY